MKKYDSYKDSGIEWIGEIPNHWNISRYRYFYFSNMGVTLLKEDVKEDGIYPVYSATETDVLFGYVDEASVILNEGDIVIPARGNSIGHIKVVTSPSTSTQTTIYSKKISQNIETNFVKYFLQGLREHLFQFDRTAIPQITVNQVKNNPLVIPPPQEQTAIASFLDLKTSEIDEIIADKKRLLELYEEEKTAIINQAVTKGLDPNAPMKDSGIEWLGEIPEHWEVLPIKYVLLIPLTDGPHETPNLYQEGIPFISAEAIKGDKIDFSKMRGYISQKDHDLYSKKYKPQKGDVYMIKSGATTGNLARVETDEEFNIWSPLAAFRPNPKLTTTDFMFYYMKSASFFTAVKLGWNYGTQQNIGMNVLENLRIVKPPIKEQQSIVQHIESECSKIDFKKARTEELIELLTEYRTALISEAVTGKIKVTED